MKTKFPNLALAFGLASIVISVEMTAPAQSERKIQFERVPDPDQGKMGEVLPTPEPRYKPITEPDWRKVQPLPQFKVRPPKGAPNVVIILLDQVSYADPSAFGGPIQLPTLDRLAKEGLTYVNFHVNSLCTPSRTALLTGRNSHQNSQASVVDSATAFPGDSGMRPKRVAPLAEILRQC
jgi:hypothetical protein